MNTTEQITNEVIKLAQLSLLYGRTNRITFHEDGVRPETDTDHAIMVGMLGCGLAEKYYPELDRGLIAQLSIIHDLVEAYAGDTQTLKIDADERAAKEQREADALQRIHNEFDETFPVIAALIETYEAGQIPEARFVKAIDKFVPKITHILNRGASLRTQGIKKADAKATYDTQREDVKQYASDFPLLLEVREELVERMLAQLES